MISSPSMAAGYLRRAGRALGEAQLLLSQQATEGACSRAYFAMHAAAHAALLATGFETPDGIIKTHHNLMAEFGRKLVLGGQIDAGFGRAFNKVQDMRRLADYSAEPPPLDATQDAVEQAEAFVAAIRSLIEGLRR